MKLKKLLLKDIEYTTKEMIAYFILTHRKIQKIDEPTLSDCIRELIILIEENNKESIQEKIDTNSIRDFKIYHLVNNDELMSYGLVIFYKMLKSNKKITEKDIIAQLDVEMRVFSSRTIIIEAQKILNRL